MYRHTDFTPRVRRVLYFAREEATRLHHDYLGTEHLLLGIVREGEGVAATVLRELAIDLDTVREMVESHVARGSYGASMKETQWTPRAKTVLELAREEARLLHHQYIGTEHLLLALIREADGVAAKALRDLDVDLRTAREMAMKVLGGGGGGGGAGSLNHRRDRDTHARPVRSGSDQDGETRGAGSCHRARERDRARATGSLPSQEE